MNSRSVASIESAGVSSGVHCQRPAKSFLWIAELCRMKCVAAYGALRAFQAAARMLRSGPKLFRLVMKKFVLLSFLALTGAFFTQALNAAVSRPELVTRVESCEAILREFMANPATAIPSSVWQKARAVVIV